METSRETAGQAAPRAGLGMGSLLESRRGKAARYRQVAWALTRHGMGAVANRLGLGWLLPFQRGLLGHARRKEPYTTAEHLRLALEELGTTAIKLGQVLSTRPDLVPPDIDAELEKLWDRIAPVAGEEILKAIEKELGRPYQEVFEELDLVPLASASIGQVHAGRLRDGAAVVVKVKKPGVDQQVAVDLAILADLARRAADAGLFGETYDIEALASEFAWTLRSELDYVQEGRNADRIREVLADEPRAVVPRIFWRYTTSSVLVMERLQGVPITEFARSSADQELKRAVAKASAEILMRQVFEAGFFHADAHPGNFLVLDGGRIGLVDFGMAGQLDEETKEGLLKLLRAIVEQDSGAIVDCLDDFGVIGSAAEREGVRRDAQHLVVRYYGLPVDRFALSDYIADVLAIVRRHGLRLPTGLALVLKTVGMSEGLWRQLDPRFNAARVAEPFVSSAMSQVYSPKTWGVRALRAAEETVELGTYLPGQLRRVARRLDRGELELALRHRDLEETIAKLGDMVTRLSVAIIAAAFIMGLPVLATVWQPPAWDYIAPAWFFIGAAVALALLARLILVRRQRWRR